MKKKTQKTKTTRKTTAKKPVTKPTPQPEPEPQVWTRGYSTWDGERCEAWFNVTNWH